MKQRVKVDAGKAAEEEGGKSPTPPPGKWRPLKISPLKKKKHMKTM